MKKIPSLDEVKKSDWFKSRPPHVQKAVLKTPPGVYRLLATGQIVAIRSYLENKNKEVTCTVLVLKGHNPNCVVFDIPLNELKRLNLKFYPEVKP